jgi:hypothetical protein
MEIKKREVLYANLLGIAFVIFAGLIIEQMPETDSRIKAAIGFVAFLVFVMSEHIWVFGRNLINKDK